MLAGTGFGYDPGFTHPAGKQDLAKAIVDLVGTGVVEFISLEVDLRAAEILGVPRRQLDLPNRSLEPTLAARRLVAGVIREHLELYRQGKPVRDP